MIRNFLSKLWLIFIIKKIWKKPQKAKIIIYDHPFAYYFEKYFDKKDYQIYHNRLIEGSELNCFLLLQCLINFDFKFKSYKKRFFNYVNPKIAITMNDNNPAFFKLKEEFPNLTTIAIQKAWKYDTEFDIIYHRHKNKEKNLGYKCDYLFCYNKFVAIKFAQFIKTKKIYTIGSFLSNSKKLNSEKKNYVIFISQWRNYKKSLIYHKNLTFGDFQRNEKNFLKKLFLFLKENSLNLKVLGKTSYSSDREKKFYDEIFGDNYEFIYQSENREHYKILDEAKLTISLESTLAYENLARGNKTIFFSIRNNKEKNFDMIRFCWPEHKSEIGPNWTNSFSGEELKRLFSIIDLPQTDWLQIMNKHFRDTSIYDYNNSKFVNLLKEIN